MSEDLSRAQEKVSLELDVVLANGFDGFDCLICDSGDFSYNGHGLVICLGCGIVYHMHALKKIYKK